MQPGKIIANLFATLLFAGLVGGVFLLFGRPLLPQRHAQMVVLLPTDTMATGSVRKACVEPCLPARFDLKLAPVRPPDEGTRGNQSAAHAVE
ncbi:polymerase [Mesorhizobium argentiipisi]|uniref:Polymerase n=1 Tax=Mesorhizobium argentiipisi TaxID=3015175 RepID=A0ABU8KNA2_9HYPH